MTTEYEYGILKLEQAAVKLAMTERCEEQGHIWKRTSNGEYPSPTLECKWCGFRL